MRKFLQFCMKKKAPAHVGPRSDVKGFRVAVKEEGIDIPGRIVVRYSTGQKCKRKELGTGLRRQRLH